MSNKTLQTLTFTLVVLGAINWGLVGLVGINLVETLLGVGSGLTKLVYVLVGFSGIVELLNRAKK